MHTTVAFAEDHAGSVPFDNIEAVIDQHIRTEGNFIYIGEQNKIIGLDVRGVIGCTAARLVSPSIRRVNPYYQLGIGQAVVAPGNIHKTFFPTAPVPLETNEGLECEAENIGVGDITAIVFLSSAPPSPISGNIHTVRFEWNALLALGVWAYSEIVLDDDLPVGTYDVVGGFIEEATSLAFRFVPVGGFTRPGGLVTAGQEFVTPELQRKGGLGVWFTFNSVQLPGIEVICSAATGAGAHIGYMDVIKR